MELDVSLSNLAGVGPATFARLESIGIKTIGDLLTYYPYKYLDYSNVVRIDDLMPGISTVEATIDSLKSKNLRKGLHITEAVASDASGKLNLVWFNQPYRANSIKPGVPYYISGDFGLHRQRMSMINPTIEQGGGLAINTARIVPIYKEIKGLNSSQLRKLINKILPQLNLVKESLPGWLIDEFRLMPIVEAIRNIHFPIDSETLKKARDRVGFEELFDLSLASLLNKAEIKKFKSVAINFDLKLAKKFVSSLPFKLTDEQRVAIWQILKDISIDTPMNRLLEGDVGTGKTVVASMVAVMVINNGYQVALMAPTEILAKQHYQTISKIFSSLNMSDKIAILVGSMKASEKKDVKDKISKSKINFIIGTHSLIQEGLALDKLAFVIVDEQHRFGVKQRQVLLNKTKHLPHLLSMTATPIPRSLQLTLFGDLDISIIKNKPYSDLPITTKIISLNQRTEIYKSLIVNLKNKEQIFVVCPVIKNQKDLKLRSVETVHDELSKTIYKDYKVGLLHAKLSTTEQESIMSDFSKNKINILVSTTIIEVGVNIPNATIMVIESPERFGLAQIHQLRGRVGRDKKQGYCYLMLNDIKAPSKRLVALEHTYNGFKLAELDLEIRGPGVVYGTMQHGKIGFDLQVATLTNTSLMLSARKAATEFINRGESLLQYVQLNDRVKRLRSITTLN